MSEQQRRKAERKDSLNFLDFVVVDKGGEVLNQGLGRTLNVSEDGLLLDTHIPLLPGELLRINIGLADDLAELTGRVIHMEPAVEERYHAGIEFSDIDAEEKRVFRKYLEAFRAARKG